MYAIDPYANLGFFAVRTINRRAQKKSPPDHGKALRFLFSLLRGLRRAVCGLVSAIAAAARARQDSRLPPAFLPEAYPSAASHPAACALDSGAGDAASGRSGAFRASAHPAACRASAPASRRIHPALWLPAHLRLPCRGLFLCGGGDSDRLACRPVPAAPAPPALREYPVRSGGRSARRRRSAGQTRSPDRDR